jgi:hypothetical protein
MTVEANTPGFVEAQESLRSVLGAPVIFKIPNEKTWPEGTKINPDTGYPYDSTIKQTDAEFTEMTKTCLVILKQASPLRPQSDTMIEASGEMSGMDIILDVAHTDYLDIEGAVQMTVNGLDYKVREAKPVQIAGQIYRELVYGEQM